MASERVMTPQQLRALLDRAGLSQSAAARALEIDPRTMRRYVSGESEIPRVVEYALRWITRAG